MTVGGDLSNGDLNTATTDITTMNTDLTNANAALTVTNNEVKAAVQG